MKMLAWSFLLIFVSIAPFRLNAQPVTEIEINGLVARVFFNDGDTFKILSGTLAGRRSRIEGFNTLESYGPVQRWGRLSGREFLAIANQATENARRGGWHCETDLRTDIYGRILSFCQDLAADQVEKGLAHVMTVTSLAGEDTLLTKQQEAIAARRGLWTSGVPNYLITSLHSLDERANQNETYDRFVSTHDGHSIVQVHGRNYADCQEVCYSPKTDPLSSSTLENACMTYVSVKKRFGPTKAVCLH